MKPFRLGILQYAERVREMHDIVKFLPSPSKNGYEYDQVDWNVRDKEFSEGDICVATKDSFPASIQDFMEDTENYYPSFAH